MVPVDQLTPDPRNARRHDRRNVDAIAASLREFGQRRPLVVTQDGIVLAGNGTLEAARSLGWSTITVTRTPPGWDYERARAYALADNRTAELATWDAAVLADQLLELDAAGWELGDLGFDPMTPPAGDGDVVEDLIPEPPAEPVARLGDLWILGRHRVICGDALDRATYTRLLEGEQADALITDPPYGVAYQDRRGGAIHGDLTQAAIPLAFDLSLPHLTENGRLYMFGGSDNFEMFNRLFVHHLRQQPRLIVWVKESFVLRPNGFHSQYELVYHGWKGTGGGPEFWYHDRKQSDVWQVARDRDREHPTQKPVEVCAIPIRCSVPEGGLVLEPFGGSGSTLIAAEQLGRRAAVIELEPRFVDVIVGRWERLTGERAELVRGAKG